MLQPLASPSPAPSIAPPVNKALYIERACDRVLLRALQQGTYCQIFAPQGSGKSRLRDVTAKRLRHAGIHCVSIDLVQFGSALHSPAKLLRAITEEILHECSLSPPERWSQELAAALPEQRWLRLLRWVALSVSGPLVLLIDEVNALRACSKLDTEGFAAMVRSISLQREEHPELASLTIALFGTLEPSVLLHKRLHTAFNFGLRIKICDFSREELQGFTPILQACGLPAEPILRAVYDWTSGHPSMTNAILERLLENHEQGAASSRSAPEVQVAQAVHDLYLAAHGEKTQVLERIAGWLGRSQPQVVVSPLLDLYAQLVVGERIPAMADDSVQLALYMMGITRTSDDESVPLVQVRNRILAQRFNPSWLEEKRRERLFGDRFLLWNKSQRQDEHLLSVEDWRQAASWAETRNDVSPAETRYLLRSANAEMNRLEAAQSDAATQLEDVRNRLRRWKRRTAAALSALLIVVVGAATCSRRVRPVSDDGSASRPYTSQQAERHGSEFRSTNPETLVEREDHESAEDRSEVSARTPSRLRRAAAKSQKPHVAVQPDEPPDEESEVIDLLRSTVTKAEPTQLSPFARAFERLAVQQERFMIGSREPIKSARLAPDGQLLVTAGRYGTVREWRLVDGEFQPGRALVQNRGGINTIAYAKGRVAIAYETTGVDLIELSSMEIHALDSDNERIRFLNISSDGKWLVAVSVEGSLMRWRADAGPSAGRQKAVRLDVGPLGTNEAAFSPDGAWLIAQGRRLLIGDTQNWKLKLVDRSVPAFARAVFATQHGLLFWAKAETHGLLEQFSLNSGGSVPFPPSSPRCDGQDDSLDQLLLSKQGDRLVSVCHRGVARLWDVTKSVYLGELLQLQDTNLLAASLSPSGSHLSIGDSRGQLHVLDVATRQEVLQMNRQREGLQWLGFPANGFVYSLDNDGRLWSDPVTFPSLRQALCALLSPLQAKRASCPVRS